MGSKHGYEEGEIMKKYFVLYLSFMMLIQLVVAGNSHADGNLYIQVAIQRPEGSLKVVSDLVLFDIQTKPTVASSRILPVAVGEPILLLILFGLFHWIRSRSRRLKEAVHI
jgi:hypothetical protein